MSGASDDRFDASAANYSEEINETLKGFGVEHDYFTRHKARLIGDLVASVGRDERQMDLLDVGCGVGKIHASLQPRFRSLSGVDVSAESLKVARAAHDGVDYRHYDGRRLPFDDASFDLAMAICVFHHVPVNLWPALAREMLRVLRPAGVVLIIEHNPFNLVTQRIVRTSPLDEGAVLLRPSKLRALFRAAGGEDVKTRTVLSVPPLTSWLRAIDGACGRLPFGAQYYLLASRGHAPGR